MFKNIDDVLESIKSDTFKRPREMLRLADDAAKAVQKTNDVNIESWADKLSRQLCRISD